DASCCVDIGPVLVPDIRQAGRGAAAPVARAAVEPSLRVLRGTKVVCGVDELVGDGWTQARGTPTRIEHDRSARVVGVAVDTMQLAAPPIVVIGTVSGCPRRRRVLADALDDDARIGPAPRRRVPEE